MPCPHGIGDCSGICHLRPISPFRRRSDKTFNGGGLDSGRPPCQLPRSMFLSPLARVPGVVLVSTQIPLAFGGLGVSPPHQHVTYCKLSLCVIDHAKGTNRGHLLPFQAHFSSPIPLTLYCICKSVIGTFEHLPRIV